MSASAKPLAVTQKAMRSVFPQICRCRRTSGREAPTLQSNPPVCGPLNVQSIGHWFYGHKSGFHPGISRRVNHVPFDMPSAAHRPPLSVSSTLTVSPHMIAVVSQLINTADPEDVGQIVQLQQLFTIQYLSDIRAGDDAGELGVPCAV